MEQTDVKAQAESMKREELIKALDEMGVPVDRRSSHIRLVEEYVTHKNEILVSEKIVEQSAKDARDQGEKVLRCRFQNLLDPQKNVECTINGRKYVLMHGHDYDLPVSVIEHLNGKYGDCMCPQTEPIIDPQTGMQKGSTKVSRNRFSVVPLDLSYV